MAVHRAVIESSGSVLLERVQTALTGWRRFRGLMLRRGLPAAEGLLIPDCRSIHTCFMRFAIDVVYLDDGNRVVRIVHRMKPWRMSACMQGRSVLETPAGRAAEVQLEVGDTVRLESLPRPG